MTRKTRFDLQVDTRLIDFIEDETLEGTGISSDQFWQGFSELVHTKTQKNCDLLAKRDLLQTKINDWHVARKGQKHDPKTYKSFLLEIGYLVPNGPDFKIGTQNTDPEIASIAGPQLVVPIMNARYALNAANARWGSLYDAFYGTDAMGSRAASKDYDLDRGNLVVAKARLFLNDTFPLLDLDHADAHTYKIKNGALLVDDMPLVDPSQFVGYQGDPDFPKMVMLKNNNLHVQIIFDRNHMIGKMDKAGISNVILESVISVIMDCEDSVAAVDAEDKTLVYSNWLGLMKGDLQAGVKKGKDTITRTLSDDVEYILPDGKKTHLKGRALMLIRNVGHLMTNPAILDKHGNEVFEGLMDAMFTTLIAIHDLKSRGRNSIEGSVYIVKPKMHGPEEVAFTNEIFSLVEDVLELPKNTIKIGIMDEERRTSVNLKECIRAAKDRVAFINTGFLDRTGDEIHSSMEAGVFPRKDTIKKKPWIAAYEDQNVVIGLQCGLQGHAQIGKGMWAEPDNMSGMLAQKIAHPMAGANCAWVPSPTAATLHALHYHKVDVFARQNEIAVKNTGELIDVVLDIPIETNQNWSQDEITREVENNAQGILGYVVRWVNHGIGCSKVPDINNVGLMEDRATCRISSQHIANWLHQGIVNKTQVMEAMKRMALVVDQQNSNDPEYINMGPDFTSLAFQAACALILEGKDQPSGYTEPLLHKYRQDFKIQN